MKAIPDCKMAPSPFSLRGIIAGTIWLPFVVTISSAELMTSTSQSPPGSSASLSSPTSTTYEFNLSSNSVVTTTGPVQVFPTDDIFVPLSTVTESSAKASIAEYQYRPLFENETFPSNAVIIDLNVNLENNPLKLLCWYPISVCASRFWNPNNDTLIDVKREIMVDFLEYYSTRPLLLPYSLENIGGSILGPWLLL